MAKLVAIGDSLTQGFQSFAINKVEASYPAIIADCLGILPQFRVPDFHGRGGLPLNLEWLARALEKKCGSDISLFEWMCNLDDIADLLDEVEDYWERGKGAQPTRNDVDYHNLAVWGFEVADAYKITSEICEEAVHHSKEDWLRTPSAPRLRTAYRVLNPAQVPARNKDTQIEIARRIKKQDGEIENLIVWLGANNCLFTVVELEIRETGDTPPPPNSEYTLWTPAAFKKDYDELARQVQKIGARNVYVATVPHVTIPPVTRGIMKDRCPLPEDRKYFDYYTHFYIRDEDFDPDKHRHLTRYQAKKIDDYIDEYNKIICEQAAHKGWHVLDACQVLDRLAVRRNHGCPTYQLPPALQGLDVRLFEIAPSGKVKHGGLIGLDGIHPTSCGYAVIAQEFVKLMRKENPGIRDVDFAQVRACDTLVSRPPRTLDDMFGMLGTLERWLHLSQFFRADRYMELKPARSRSRAVKTGAGSRRRAVKHKE